MANSAIIKTGSYQTRPNQRRLRSMSALASGIGVVVLLTTISPSANAAGRLTSGQVNTKLARACIAFEQAPVPESEETVPEIRKTITAFGKAIAAHDRIAKTIVPIDPIEQGAIRTLRGFTNAITLEVATIVRLLAKTSTQDAGLERFNNISDRFTARGIGLRSVLEENNLFVCLKLLPRGARDDAPALDATSDTVAVATPTPGAADPIPVTTIPINPFAIPDPSTPVAGGPTSAPPSGTTADVTADDLALEPFFSAVPGYSYVRSAVLDAAVAGIKTRTAPVYSAALGKQVQDPATGVVRSAVLVYRFRELLTPTVLDQVIKQSAKVFDGVEVTGVGGFRVISGTYSGQDKIFAVRTDVAIEITGPPTPGKRFVTDLAATLLTQAPPKS
jgi:hypothetical protein